MKLLYWLLIFMAFACQSNKRAEEKPDAYRDLLIDRVIWKKSDVSKPQETPTNRHWFTMTNTSESFSYRKIEVRLDYFDSTYHKISSSKRIIDQTIEPRAALAIGEIEDGLVKPAAKSATVTVVKAEADRVEPD